MTKDTLNDTDDLKDLKKVAINLFEENQLYKSENKVLQEQIKSLQDRLFGRKTEKIPKVTAT